MPSGHDGVMARQSPHAVRILVTLTLANLVNFYDRTVPAIVIEPAKQEFGLSDGQIGVISSAFTVVYALAGIVLGKMADRGRRRVVMAVGLVVWSVFTALSGGAWSFLSLLVFRMGVGIGEASYAPAANSMLFDAFPAERRARAVGVFQLGVPVGLLLAFVTVGWMVEATGSWRVPFFVAALPGLVLAGAMLTLPEPARGAADATPVGGLGPPTSRPVRAILGIPTMRWLILAGIGIQIPGYAVATFLVPLLQRYFGLSIGAASLSAGVVLGITGVAGLLLGGWGADRASLHSSRARLLVGVAGLVLAVPFSLAALLVPASAAWAFVALLAGAWFWHYFFATAALPSIADVVEPRLRATAVAVYFAGFYLLGGSVGPVLTGFLSDRFAAGARAGTAVSAEAVGLHQALLVLVPAALVLAVLAAFGAAHTITADRRRATAPGTPPIL